MFPRAYQKSEDALYGMKRRKQALEQGGASWGVKAGTEKSVGCFHNSIDGKKIGL